MTDLKYTQTRHRMLTEISQPRAIYLNCVNTKRAIWKPRRPYIGEVNLSSAEARAVNDILGARSAHSPHWQGDMDVLREVELTDAGRVLLSQWDKQYGEVKA